MKLFIIISFQYGLYFFSMINTGINQFNNMIYFEKIKAYKNQNNSYTCSPNDGPNCFYSEKIYLEKLYKDIQTTNKNYKINNINEKWFEIYQKAQNTSYENYYKDLLIDIQSYIFRNKDNRDNEQNPPKTSLQFSITFNTFDNITKNKDIYISPSSIVPIFNEEISINFEGKLKLSFNKHNINKKNKYFKDYPSNTYGYIESEYISFNLNGKFFLCEHIHIKPHDINNYNKFVRIMGFNNNIMIFHSNYTLSDLYPNQWTKLLLPLNYPITNLTISGGYDIDNILIFIDNKINFIISDLYHSDPKRKTKELINSDDF